MHKLSDLFACSHSGFETAAAFSSSKGGANFRLIAITSFHLSQLDNTRAKVLREVAYRLKQQIVKKLNN